MVVEFSYVNASNVSANRTDDSLIEIVVFQHTQLEHLGVLYAVLLLHSRTSLNFPFVGQVGASTKVRVRVIVRV